MFSFFCSFSLSSRDPLGVSDICDGRMWTIPSVARSATPSASKSQGFRLKLWQPKASTWMCSRWFCIFPYFPDDLYFFQVTSANPSQWLRFEPMTFSQAQLLNRFLASRRQRRLERRILTTGRPGSVTQNPPEPGMMTCFQLLFLFSSSLIWTLPVMEYLEPCSFRTLSGRSTQILAPSRSRCAVVAAGRNIFFRRAEGISTTRWGGPNVNRPFFGRCLGWDENWALQNGPSILESIEDTQKTQWHVPADWRDEVGLLPKNLVPFLSLVVLQEAKEVGGKRAPNSCSWVNWQPLSDAYVGSKMQQINKLFFRCSHGWRWHPQWKGSYCSARTRCDISPNVQMSTVPFGLTV